MKKPLNILSIDWDYFVNATDEQRTMDFPDPNDNLGYKLGTFIWCNRYSDNPSIKDIGVTVNEYDELKKYLTKILGIKNSSNTEVMVTNSHKMIYDFVTTHKGFSSSTPINLYHIDYHSDVYGMTYPDDSKKELDCGNWLNYLCDYLDDRAFKFSKATWLKRKDSDDYDDLPKFMRSTTYDPTTDDLGDMINLQFHNKLPDLIFLCRSNPWSPPHLDDKFDELFEVISKIGSVRYSSDISNRYTPEFEKLYADMRESLDNLRKSI